MTPREARAVLDAARAALATIEREPTASNAEIDRARRAARKAHAAWLDAALDKLTGTSGDEIAEAAA